MDFFPNLIRQPPVTDKHKRHDFSQYSDEFTITKQKGLRGFNDDVSEIEIGSQNFNEDSFNEIKYQQKLLFGQDEWTNNKKMKVCQYERVEDSFDGRQFVGVNDNQNKSKIDSINKMKVSLESKLLAKQFPGSQLIKNNHHKNNLIHKQQPQIRQRKSQPKQQTIIVPNKSLVKTKKLHSLIVINLSQLKKIKSQITEYFSKQQANLRKLIDNARHNTQIQIRKQFSSCLTRQQTAITNNLKKLQKGEQISLKTKLKQSQQSLKQLQQTIKQLKRQYQQACEENDSLQQKLFDMQQKVVGIDLQVQQKFQKKRKQLQAKIANEMKMKYQYNSNSHNNNFNNHNHNHNNHNNSHHQQPQFIDDVNITMSLPSSFQQQHQQQPQETIKNFKYNDLMQRNQYLQAKLKSYQTILLETDNLRSMKSQIEQVSVKLKQREQNLLSKQKQCDKIKIQLNKRQLELQQKQSSLNNRLNEMKQRLNAKQEYLQNWQRQLQSQVKINKKMQNNKFTNNNNIPPLYQSQDDDFVQKNNKTSNNNNNNKLQNQFKKSNHTNKNNSNQAQSSSIISTKKNITLTDIYNKKLAIQLQQSNNSLLKKNGQTSRHHHHHKTECNDNNGSVSNNNNNITNNKVNYDPAKHEKYQQFDCSQRDRFYWGKDNGINLNMNLKTERLSPLPKSIDLPYYQGSKTNHLSVNTNNNNSNIASSNKPQPNNTNTNRTINDYYHHRPSTTTTTTLLNSYKYQPQYATKPQQQSRMDNSYRNISPNNYIKQPNSSYNKSFVSSSSSNHNNNSNNNSNNSHIRNNNRDTSNSNSRHYNNNNTSHPSNDRSTYSKTSMDNSSHSMMSNVNKSRNHNNSNNRPSNSYQGFQMKRSVAKYQVAKLNDLGTKIDFLKSQLKSQIDHILE